MVEARRVIVSRDIFDAHGQDILQCLSAASERYELLPIDADVNFVDLPLDTIEAGFISPDVLGESSKTVLTPFMGTFCNILLSAPRLRWTQVPSAGTDRPQFQQLMQAGVTLTHAGGVAATTVAHSVIAGMLALIRDMPKWARLQQQRHWQPARGADAPGDLPGQTVVVVGLGAIGTHIGRLCQALGLTVIGLSRSGSTGTACCDEVHPIGQLSDVLPRADWLILCCPLTPETRHLVARKQLELLHPGAFLIDVSRGGVTDNQALLHALSSRHLRGAYLDVFETEPLPDTSPFWDLENVIITPHAAGDSRGRSQKLVELFIENLHRYVHGHALKNMVCIT